MAWVLVRHKVEDYNKWRPHFDGPATVLQTSGTKGGQVFHTEGDPNEIWVLLEWEDAAAIRRFMGSHDLEQAMKESGVTDKPDVCVLEELPKPSV